MYKFCLPPSERHIHQSKNSSISDKPNIPTCCNNHFHEKWLTKTFLGIAQNSLQIIMLLSLNLKIVPNSATEIALKK
jgi:hypothetical protein